MSNKPNTHVQNTGHADCKQASNEKIGPCVQFKWKEGKEEGHEGSLDINFSDGTELSIETFTKYVTALKKATGTDEHQHSVGILRRISKGFPSGDDWERMTQAAAMLPLLRPQDETEALLAGQFLSLQETAMKYLRLAATQEGFYHLERYTLLANKLFNSANQTMQMLLKYRFRGQQTVQVIYMHNQGQAIVAQNLSHSGEGGDPRKSEN